ncbi:hypothetical protein A3Q56_08245 [Intoshia linei]|uniref:Uncharacterized protein n=1 Tax=Intoshia linei TaxID=1819745 RepID=A0A177AQH2_9BILA|nr:hypothetical protein A3Q56_08245 [Intoshia linei]
MKPEKCILFLTQNDELSAIKDELFCSLCKKIVNHSSGRLHILGKKHLMLKFVSHLSVDTLIIPKAKHTQINKKNIDLTNVDILLIIEKKEINGKKLFYISIGKTIDPINYIACKINDNISIELVNNTLQELHLKKENFILLIIR